MKGIRIFALVSVLMFGLNSTGFAHTLPADKIKNGLYDIVTAPIGLFTYPSDRVNSSDEKLTALLFGVMEGTDSFLGKTISGVVNILTFPFPGDF